MQPDPTPDLDDLTRDVSLAGAHYAHRDPEGRAGLACPACHAATRVRNALPWLLRAARKRDELRVRAEKAEARAKELEGMLTKAEPRLAVALRQSRNRNELDALYATNDLADIRDALAQKEPR